MRNESRNPKRLRHRFGRRRATRRNRRRRGKQTTDAMPLDRIPCRSKSCTNTILPATASANDGFCMPCVQKRKRADRNEFIRQNRRTADLYEGITDQAEIIRDRLFTVMSDTKGTLSINHVLCALAWIGDQRVCDEFWGWENSPPRWRGQLHFGPSRHAHVAGWEPTENGRRDLYHKTCFAIRPVKAGENSSESVVLLKESSGHCRWCHSRLVSLLELNLSAPEFSFLGFGGPYLPVVTCEACSCFGAVYGKVDQAGVAHWSDTNRRPNWLPGNIASWRRGPWSGVQVRLTPRRAIHAVDWCMPVTTSQIGGLPSWVQNAEYPCCPECRKTMTFIAQLDNGHFPGSEGIYYAFLCTNCRITATIYQQT